MGFKPTEICDGCKLFEDGSCVPVKNEKIYRKMTTEEITEGDPGENLINWLNNSMRKIYPKNPEEVDYILANGVGGELSFEEIEEIRKKSNCSNKIPRNYEN